MFKKINENPKTARDRDRDRDCGCDRLLCGRGTAVWKTVMEPLQCSFRVKRGDLTPGVLHET